MCEKNQRRGSSCLFDAPKLDKVSDPFSPPQQTLNILLLVYVSGTAGTNVREAICFLEKAHYVVFAQSGFQISVKYRQQQQTLASFIFFTFVTLHSRNRADICLCCTFSK